MGESSKRGGWADPGRQPERGAQMEAVKGQDYYCPPWQDGKETKDWKSNHYKVVFSSGFSCLLICLSESPMFPL